MIGMETGVAAHTDAPEPQLSPLLLASPPGQPLCLVDEESATRFSPIHRGTVSHLFSSFKGVILRLLRTLIFPALT